jgi:hypothetical protein
MDTKAPKNPAASLDALAATPELTLGKMAVLTRINSPILVGEASDIPSTLTALWILAAPFEEVLDNRADLETPALKWGERMEPAEYRRRIIAAMDAVNAYYAMLPRKEPDPKKKRRGPGTGKSPSSPSGSAASTDGLSGTSSTNCQPSRRHSSGAAGPKAQAASRAGRSRRTKSHSRDGE